MKTFLLCVSSRDYSMDPFLRSLLRTSKKHLQARAVLWFGALGFTAYRALGVGLGCTGLGLRVQGLGWGIQGSWLRVVGSRSWRAS